MKKNLTPCLLCLSGLILFTSNYHLHGADVFSTGTDGGSTGWNLSTVWSNGEAPSAGNDYFIQSGSIHVVRTPQIAAHQKISHGTFAGNSLTVNAGGRLLAKGSFVVENLILNGGTVRHGEANSNTSATWHIVEWDGAIEVAADSTIDSLNSVRRFEVTGEIGGAGNLNMNFAVSSVSTASFTAAEQSANTGGVYLQAANPNYFGTLNVTNGILKAQAVGSLGDASVVLNGTSGFDVDYAWTNALASLTINSGSMMLLDQHISIGALTLGGVALAEGNTYDYDYFVSNGFGSFFADTSTGSISVIPEPSTYALIAGSLALLVFFRRREGF